MTRRMVSAMALGIAGVAILLGLGFWQVQRLEWKTAILDRLEQRLAAEPVPIPAEPSEDADEYRRVHAEGEVLGGELHVYTGAPGGGVGYRVVAPFELQDGRRILLDRGVVPIDDKDAERSTGPASVEGMLLWPDDGGAGSPPDMERNVWIARDVDLMSEALGTAPVLVVAETSEGPQGPVPLPVSLDIPNNHLGYSVTWFGLAMAWAGMTVYLLWRIKRRID